MAINKLTDATFRKTKPSASEQRKRAARTATFLNVQASVFLHHNEDGDADDAPGGSEETC